MIRKAKRLPSSVEYIRIPTYVYSLTLTHMYTYVLYRYSTHYVHRQTPAVTRWKYRAGNPISLVAPQMKCHPCLVQRKKEGHMASVWNTGFYSVYTQHTVLPLHKTQVCMRAPSRHAFILSLWWYWEKQHLHVPTHIHTHIHTHTHTHAHTHTHTHTHTHSCIPVHIHFSPGYDALSSTPFLCKLLEFADPLSLQLVEGLPRRQTHIIHPFRVWHT